MLPSRTMLPSILRGFAPWPPRNAYQPEATAFVLFALFVACVAGLWSCWQFESGADQGLDLIYVGAPL